VTPKPIGTRDGKQLACVRPLAPITRRWNGDLRCPAPADYGVIASTLRKEANMFFRKSAAATQPPLYYLIDPRPAEVLGPWADAFPAYGEVIGYSSLGHFFLRDPDSQEYIVLHPFKGSAKSYGSHQTIGGFEQSVLKEPGFQEYVLRPEHVRTVARRVGALSKGEIYFPEPYPILGGSDAPETYSKGNAWVFSHIVAQLGGL
jgi:Domain of unknown function (DUF1851)